MKQIFIPTSKYKFDKIHKNKIQEKSYVIALSSRGLYHFQNNKVNKIVDNITNSYVIEIQTNKKIVEIFINELHVDSLHVSHLPLDIQIISITKEIYKFQNIDIHVENYNNQKQVWFECQNHVTTDSIVEEISLILSLINV